MRESGVAHAKRDRTDGRGAAARCLAHARWIGIDDDVHAPLPVEQDLARSMPRYRQEAELLQQCAERKRLAGGVFDEFDTLDPERIRRGRQVLLIHGLLAKPRIGTT